MHAYTHVCTLTNTCTANVHGAACTLMCTHSRKKKKSQQKGARSKKIDGG